MPPQAGIHRRLELNADDSLASRFWNRVDKGAVEECWLWLASFRNGYGAIKHRGRVHSAHRVAYILTHGEPSSDLVIAHKCDNRACCNPHHLEAVTPGSNVRDAHYRSGIQYAKGEESPHAKLTEEAVAKLWIDHRDGASRRELAKKFGVAKRTIDKIISGQTWKHLRPSWAK